MADETNYDGALYGDRWAAIYDDEVAPQFPPRSTSSRPVAGKGPALEFAVGTGRFAIPLIERGIKVDGIDTSAAMVEKLHAQRPKARVEIGDMATVDMGRTYPLVFVVATSLFLVLDQRGPGALLRERGAAHDEEGRVRRQHSWTPLPLAVHRRPDRAHRRRRRLRRVARSGAARHAPPSGIDVQYVSIARRRRRAVPDQPPLRVAVRARPHGPTRRAAAAGAATADGTASHSPSTSPEHVSVYRRA